MTTPLSIIPCCFCFFRSKPLFVLPATCFLFLVVRFIYSQLPNNSNIECCQTAIYYFWGCSQGRDTSFFVDNGQYADNPQHLLSFFCSYGMGKMHANLRMPVQAFLQECCVAFYKIVFDSKHIKPFSHCFENLFRDINRFEKLLLDTLLRT